MRALGDKIGSTIIAQSAGTPCISWNGDGINVDYQTEGIPPEVYDAANVKTTAAAVIACRKVGFPVMIKASEGGGGKGIRMVHEESKVEQAYTAVQGEIPGSPIFVMKLAPRARHLEVQLLADAYGTAIALNGRDCSVQRRHQKIIEEGPPLANDYIDETVWKKMCQAAVSLAQAVGYCNAGTVEYLYEVTDKGEERQGDGFYFLELNPRLQVKRERERELAFH
jgi:acetyl-CoA carboxylase/biotin carboxylase 1